MTLAVAAILAGAIASPHLLRLEHAPPVTAAVIWSAALALRALMAVGIALFVVLWLPATDVFQLITHWCWHRVLPFIAVHLGLDGHSIGDLAVVLPGIALAASVLSVLVGLWTAARRVRAVLRGGALGPGPRQSVLIRDGEVVVAAAGLRRPQVVVSAGALVAFDDEELDASLDHEEGHIARRHRFVLVAAEICRAVGRFLPGTRRAVDELVFHLERDADRFAIGRRHDPAALASAICKAAAPGPFSLAPALSLGGQGPTVRRVRELLEGATGARGPAAAGLRVVAALMVTLVVATAAALPLAAQAAPARGGAGTWQHCET